MEDKVEEVKRKGNIRTWSVIGINFNKLRSALFQFSYVGRKCLTQLMKIKSNIRKDISLR